MKGREPVTCPIPTSCSWALKKILECREIVQNVGGWKNTTTGTNYSIKKVYTTMQGTYPKVARRRVICNNKDSPRSIFVTWLAALNRLSTTNRLISWGIQCTAQCVLCSSVAESAEHLFFDCSFSSDIWKKILGVLGIRRSSFGFSQELSIVAYQSRKTGATATLYAMCFAEAVYAIWLHRNLLIFSKTSKTPIQLVKEILFKVSCRCYEELSSKLLM
ncbi:uncharacterized protein [Spinacia oleracea]|uniref:Reverse transcriptase zinc-binding domain-containing protein n=1 Tax=Spinacia oleracea TaxID=3562 RepID=A0A9R0JCT4_SPIOL|nr:uncharacterized protein LOC110804292 [Spinacia oleracea]